MGTNIDGHKLFWLPAFVLVAKLSLSCLTKYLFDLSMVTGRIIQDGTKSKQQYSTHNFVKYCHIRRKICNKGLLNIPHHLKRVAALPSEILMSENYFISVDNSNFGPILQQFGDTVA